MRGSCLIKNNLSNIFKKLRWLVSGCLIFLFVQSCQRSDANNLQIIKINKQETIKRTKAISSVKSIEPLIKNGDLITRTGNDFTSETLRSLNRRNKKYSHCGIAIIENDSVFVYHALGGDFNPNQKLLRQSLIEFADPASNRGIGLFSFNFNANLQTKIREIVQNHFVAGLPFDMEFNLETNDKMYCAEFVAKSYIDATDNNLNFNKSKIENFSFYGVDDIFLNPTCHLIKELIY